MQSCKKTTIPIVNTADVSEITPTTATSGGNVTNNGGQEVTSRGVCWGITPNLTIDDQKTIDGSGNGSFISNIKGLTSNTEYYVKAYATNSEGTGYGIVLSFKTIQVSCMFCKQVTYIDGIYSNASAEMEYCGDYLLEILNASPIIIGNTMTQWECR